MLFSIAIAGVLALTTLPLIAVQDVVQETPAKEKPVRIWHAQVGGKAPVFELQGLDGTQWRLEDQLGKVVVLEWFNPDCPFVQKAHGKGGPLRDLGNRAAADGVAWVAINSGAPGQQGSGPERNAKAAEALGLRYPLLLDETGWVGAMYGAETTPHMFVIDAAGTLAYAGGHEGADGRDLVSGALASVRDGLVLEHPATRSIGCSVKYPPQAAVGLVGPRFLLPDLDGDRVSLADLRGSVVVLEWFNPECPVVNRAHDAGGALEDLADRMQAMGVVWLAVNSGAPGNQGFDPAKNRAAVAKWGLGHPVLKDEKGMVGQAWGARTTPHMFVMDRRGVVAYAGAHDDRTGKPLVEQAITAVLKGQPPETARSKPYGCSVKYDEKARRGGARRKGEG